MGGESGDPLSLKEEARMSHNRRMGACMVAKPRSQQKNLVLHFYEGPVDPSGDA
jgi:hypothetical protein